MEKITNIWVYELYMHAHEIKSYMKVHRGNKQDHAPRCPDRQDLLDWFWKCSQDAPVAMQLKWNALQKQHQNPFISDGVPRVALFKNTSEEAPSSILPWWKKHDKVCFVWRLHIWENTMKCPQGGVLAEQQKTETCTLQCPTCWSNGCIWRPRIFSTCSLDYTMILSGL